MHFVFGPEDDALPRSWRSRRVRRGCTFLPSKEWKRLGSTVGAASLFVRRRPVCKHLSGGNRHSDYLTGQRPSVRPCPQKDRRNYRRIRAG